MSDVNENQSEGALVEFTALRSEIATRINLQHQVIAVHVTAVSVVFSVALSGGSRWSTLLVIPFMSYAFSESLASLFRTVEGLAKYIDEVLSPKVGGGLGWESWLVQHKPHSEVRRITHPYYLFFPGVSAVALIASGVFIFVSRGGVYISSVFHFGRWLSRGCWVPFSPHCPSRLSVNYVHRSECRARLVRALFARLDRLTEPAPATT
ncbi:hypothetical protein [Streptomyces phytohabitans]|uniref:hypothetical protein n=1 Tax=Streptomyces phytohabitans TaxID=1150371 RepID=UPI00345C5E59